LLSPQDKDQENVTIIAIEIAERAKTLERKKRS
jgi:hypothetical protein